MEKEIKPRQDVETQLEAALDVAENSTTKYHIRGALQKLQIEERDD